jgi:hypothetical protein
VKKYSDFAVTFAEETSVAADDTLIARYRSEFLLMKDADVDAFHSRWLATFLQEAKRTKDSSLAFKFRDNALRIASALGNYEIAATIGEELLAGASDLRIQLSLHQQLGSTYAWIGDAKRDIAFHRIGRHHHKSAAAILQRLFDETKETALSKEYAAQLVKSLVAAASVDAHDDQAVAAYREARKVISEFGLAGSSDLSSAGISAEQS